MSLHNLDVLNATLRTGATATQACVLGAVAAAGGGDGAAAAAAGVAAGGGSAGAPSLQQLKAAFQTAAAATRCAPRSDTSGNACSVKRVTSGLLSTSMALRPLQDVLFHLLRPASRHNFVVAPVDGGYGALLRPADGGMSHASQAPEWQAQHAELMAAQFPALAGAAVGPAGGVAAGLPAAGGLAARYGLLMIYLEVDETVVMTVQSRSYHPAHVRLGNFHDNVANLDATGEVWALLPVHDSAELTGKPGSKEYEVAQVHRWRLFQAALDVLVDGVRALAAEGMWAQLADDFVVRLFPRLFLRRADWPGAQGMLCLTTSPSSTRPCRVCLARRPFLHAQPDVGPRSVAGIVALVNTDPSIPANVAAAKRAGVRAVGRVPAFLRYLGLGPRVPLLLGGPDRLHMFKGVLEHLLFWLFLFFGTVAAAFLHATAHLLSFRGGPNYLRLFSYRRLATRSRLESNTYGDFLSVLLGFVLDLTPDQLSRGYKLQFLRALARLYRVDLTMRSHHVPPGGVKRLKAEGNALFRAVAALEDCQRTIKLHLYTHGHQFVAAVGPAPVFDTDVAESDHAKVKEAVEHVGPQVGVEDVSAHWARVLGYRALCNDVDLVVSLLSARRGGGLPFGRGGPLVAQTPGQPRLVPSTLVHADVRAAHVLGEEAALGAGGIVPRAAIAGGVLVTLSGGRLYNGQRRRGARGVLVARCDAAVPGMLMGAMAPPLWAPPAFDAVAEHLGLPTPQPPPLDGVLSPLEAVLQACAANFGVSLQLPVGDSLLDAATGRVRPRHCLLALAAVGVRTYDTVRVFDAAAAAAGRQRLFSVKRTSREPLHRPFVLVRVVSTDSTALRSAVLGADVDDEDGPAAGAGAGAGGAAPVAAAAVALFERALSAPTPGALAGALATSAFLTTRGAALRPRPPGAECKLVVLRVAPPAADANYSDALGEVEELARLILPLELPPSDMAGSHGVVDASRLMGPAHVQLRHGSLGGQQDRQLIDGSAFGVPLWFYAQGARRGVLPQGLSDPLVGEEYASGYRSAHDDDDEGGGDGGGGGGGGGGGEADFEGVTDDEGEATPTSGSESSADDPPGGSVGAHSSSDDDGAPPRARAVHCCSVCRAPGHSIRTCTAPGAEAARAARSGGAAVRGRGRGRGGHGGSRGGDGGSGSRGRRT